jgi:hypothetical protein
MRLACLFVSLMRIDLSARGEGCWSVMWLGPLWLRNRRWIVI